MAERGLKGFAVPAKPADGMHSVPMGHSEISAPRGLAEKRRCGAAQCQTSKVTASPTAETRHHRSEASATHQALAASSA